MGCRDHAFVVLVDHRDSVDEAIVLIETLHPQDLDLSPVLQVLMEVVLVEVIEVEVVRGLQPDRPRLYHVVFH